MHSMPEPGQRLCIECGYVLDHLTERRCPECGRAFDDDDEEDAYDPWLGAAPLPRWAILIGWATLAVIFGLSVWRIISYF